MIASDANQVLDQPDQQLLNLIPASRSVTIESVSKLRRICMEFLAACISWDQFRCLPFCLPSCQALPFLALSLSVLLHLALPPLQAHSSILPFLLCHLLPCPALSWSATSCPVLSLPALHALPPQPCCSPPRLPGHAGFPALHHLPLEEECICTTYQHCSISVSCLISLQHETLLHVILFSACLLQPCSNGTQQDCLHHTFHSSDSRHQSFSVWCLY